ncbi:MAG TPA: SAM domain-containing protein [Bradyrhizobium sp.]|uniref:SAM domain-containing protein n=1 Tax=Bradyrhizobium sp. TaxID=376 RepID=UPI002BF3659A|nr:SAM domain-containing protein [Bradyrhizobium sp.]HLZ03106.1 SAM domain-containing protein [Bradyrhizobium sp.]
MAVEQWLRNLGLAQYAKVFAENDIDFDVLSGLTEADLKELGVASLGHRRRLLAAISELQSASPSHVSPTAELLRVRSAFESAGLAAFLPRVDAALAK